MKKSISVLLGLILALTSFMSVGFSAYAEEVQTQTEQTEEEAQAIALNTTYKASFDGSDKLLDSKAKQYYDAFKFDVEYGGKVTLNVKSAAKGYLSKYAQYIISDTKSDKFWSPDSASFSGKWTVKLKKGSYYFFAIYTKTNNKRGKMLGADYSFKLSYKPTLKAVQLKKLKAKKNGFKASWKKDKSVSGYQLQYSTKKNFSKAKKLKLENAKSLSAAVEELKAKKKYYVRVRTYKTFTFGEKTKTFYSPWSKAKTVKTK